MVCLSTQLPGQRELVESSFGSLHNEVPLNELCVDLWCCNFKQFHIRKIHRSPSGILCVVIDCEPWQHVMYTDIHTIRVWF